MSTHSIVLADDHPAFMEGVAMKIEREPSLEIVGTATNGKDALELVLELNPDLLLVDMDMPQMSGLEVVQELKNRDSPVRALPLSGHADPEYVMGTLESGAAGYIMKDESLSTIVEAVKSVLDGGVYISSRVSQQIVTRQMTSHNRGERKESTIRRLLELGVTPRRLQVLKLTGQGFNNREIAEKLFKSEHTIRNQVDQLKQLSGTRWRPGVVAWAWRTGVFEVDDDEFERAFADADFVRRSRSSSG
ncbi:MAG: response regulator transcription factor [Rhodothermales bacterium]|nr:response regulator transcription factor [Rhodothermales bacterium]